MMDVRWIGFGLIAAASAAGVTIFGRLGLTGVDTTLATTLRSIVMTLALVAVAVGNGSLGALVRGETAFDARAWRFVLLAGACGAASWLAYFAALRLAAAGPVAALDRLSLPMVFVLGVLLLGEKPGRASWLGLLLVLVGIYLIAADAVRRSGG
ncbi:MAG: EamA family transporter [Myxococcota bacterium]